ncbi:hypothetical protein [Almyronema epifaneia]|uniref:Uncharacterized protein n=1 Tax=Almyronema epifaneia S1 TaxID=2991925 RepID=A0ABW6IDU8_9CYAN
MTPKSGVFLAGACLAAISAVAAIFELTSGEPDWGAMPTIALLAVCVPLGGFFFYAAVKDARANQQ